MEEKLKRVLTKIVDRSYTFSDDSILQQLHKHLADYVIFEEFCQWKDTILLPWCLKVIVQWESLKKNIKLFVLQVAKIVTNRSSEISKVLATDLMNKINDLVKVEQSDLSLMLNYTELVANVVNHIDGAYWFMDSDTFKNIISVKLLNRSPFLCAQVGKLISNAISVLQKEDLEKCFQLMDQILEPLSLHRPKPNSPRTEEFFAEAEKYLSTPDETLPIPLRKGSGTQRNSSTIKLLSSLMESKSSELYLCKLLDDYDFEAWIWRTAFSKVSSQEDIIDFITLIVHMKFYELPPISLEKKDELLLVVSHLHRLVFLKKQHRLAFNITLQCMQLASCRDKNLHSQFDLHLFAFFLIPLEPFLKLVLQKNRNSNSYTHSALIKYSDTFWNLDKMSQVEVVRLTIKNIDRTLTHINKENLDLLIGILICVLETFYKSQNGLQEAGIESLCVNYMSGLLSDYPNFTIDVLSALEIIFKSHVTVTWHFMTQSSILKHLQNVIDCNESTSYVKIRILFLLASIINRLEPTNDPGKNDRFVEEIFYPLSHTLMKNLCHPQWEIRDGVIEVLKSMTVQGEKGFPKFIDFILSSDFPNSVYNIAVQDDDLYAQISALQCLQKMVKSKRIWDDCLSSLNLLEKIMDRLKIDRLDGALARREQILLITEIFKTGGIRDSQMSNVYKQLVDSATVDLYWEVKVGALRFWEAVIQTVYEDNNLVDGIFPSDSKPVGLTKCEPAGNSASTAILKNILERLNEIGCLHVLWETLNDDCDLEVSKTSASITTNLLGILKLNNYIEKTYPQKSLEGDQTNNTQNGSNQEQMQVGDTEPGSETKISDDVIQFIVNNRDIDLLSSMSCQDEQSRETDKRRTESKTEHITVDVFLSKLSKMNLEEFIRMKEDWMQSTDSFVSLIDIILCADSNRDQLINAIDCY